MRHATDKTPASRRKNEKLAALLIKAKDHVMSPAEIDAQRKSWVCGEMLLQYPTMTYDEASALYDAATASATSSPPSEPRTAKEDHYAHTSDAHHEGGESNVSVGRHSTAFHNRGSNDALVDGRLPPPLGIAAGQWFPIAEADRSIATVQAVAETEIVLRNSHPVWVRDEDGRTYEAVWSEGAANYWWDLEGEWPADPVEFMPHPLDPRFHSERQPNLVDYFERQIAWSRETFGPALRTKGIIEHIGKELSEIERKPHDLSEWVDVITMALDGFWRHGGTAAGLFPALLANQQKNMARSWPDWRTMSEDSAIEHDRSKDAALKLEGRCDG